MRGAFLPVCRGQLRPDPLEASRQGIIYLVNTARLVVATLSKVRRKGLRKHAASKGGLYCSDVDEPGMRECWSRVYLRSSTVRRSACRTDRKRRFLWLTTIPNIRKSLEMLLMSAGYDVATADNPVTAVSHLSRTIPDLIVTGLEICTCQSRADLSCTRLSSFDFDCRDEQGLQRGSCGRQYHRHRFYPKGQNPNHLLTTIASLIATSQAHRVARDDRARPTLDS